eukprot:jgi/Chrzof1/13764/Cz08g11100.t1
MAVARPADNGLKERHVKSSNFSKPGHVETTTALETFTHGLTITKIAPSTSARVQPRSSSTGTISASTSSNTTSVVADSAADNRHGSSPYVSSSTCPSKTGPSKCTVPPLSCTSNKSPERASSTGSMADKARGSSGVGSPTDSSAGKQSPPVLANKAAKESTTSVRATSPSRRYPPAAHTKTMRPNINSYDLPAAVLQHKERRRAEIYALNAILCLSEQAATAALIKNMAAAGQTILTPQLAAELHHSV